MGLRTRLSRRFTRQDLKARKRSELRDQYENMIDMPYRDPWKGVVSTESFIPPEGAGSGDVAVSDSAARCDAPPPKPSEMLTESLAVKRAASALLDSITVVLTSDLDPAKIACAVFEHVIALRGVTKGQDEAALMGEVLAEIAAVLEEDASDLGELLLDAEFGVPEGQGPWPHSLPASVVRAIKGGGRAPEPLAILGNGDYTREIGGGS